MEVYITVEKGFLYVHSNFVSPGAEYPTKIATTEHVDLDTLLYNLIGEDTPRTGLGQVRIYVDKNALDASSYQLDFSLHKNTKFIDLAADAVAARRAQELAREKAEREAREKAQAAARAAEGRRKQDTKTSEFASAMRSHRDDLATRRANLAQAVREATTEDVRFFAAIPHAGATELVFPDQSVFVFKDELASLQRGQRLPNDHPLTTRFSRDAGKPQVVYTEGFRETKEALGASDALTFALQKCYPEHWVFLDPLSDDTARKAAALAKARLASPSDFVTILAEEGFQVTDWNMMRNIQPELAKLGFTNFVSVSTGASIQWTYGSGKSVLVISGHMDAKLASFLDALGSAGVFSGNYVLLNTCNAQATRGVVSRITQQHKASAVFAYEGTITAAQVEGMLVDLVTDIKSATEGFVNILKRVMTKHKLVGVWSVCLYQHEPRARYSSVRAT